MSVLGFEPKGIPSYFQRIHIIILTTHHRVTPKNTNTHHECCKYNCHFVYPFPSNK